MLDGLGLAEDSGLPAVVSDRLEALMRAPGEGADYAVCLTTRQLRWLYWLDPGWTRKHLIPTFKIGHDLCEPAWNGFLLGAQVGRRQERHIPRAPILGERRATIVRAASSDRGHDGAEQGPRAGS